MIKFFRRIRQRLLSENKFSKYLVYAVGEIVLVVIGILIALSINNWNSYYQKRALERDYLSEIRGNLVKDTLSINSALKFHAAKTDSIANALVLFQEAKQGKPYFDAFRPKMAILAEHVTFEPVRTAFDNMVSSEKIGLISNRDLRTTLSNYYSDLSYRDGTQQRILQLTREFTDDIMSKSMSQELMKSFIGLDLDLRSTEDIDIHADPQVISNLFVILQVTETLTGELNERKQTAGEIIDQISGALNE